MTTDSRDHPTFIKLCGFTRPFDVEQACLLDIEALGFVFARDAKRPLSKQMASPLLRSAQGARIERVAVVGAMSRDDCRRILDLGFDAVQVVMTDFCEPELDGRPVIPVFFDGPDVEARVQHAVLDRWSGASVTETICMDGPKGGGKGIPPDWDRAAKVAEQAPLLLAGGLRPETVAGAIARVRPRGVDVSSGIEGSDGNKDPALMAAFVAAVRAVC